MKAGFASKRKFLANNLTAVFGKEEVRHALDVCAIDAKARAEDVPLEKWLEITRKLR